MMLEDRHYRALSCLPSEFISDFTHFLLCACDYERERERKISDIKSCRQCEADSFRSAIAQGSRARDLLTLLCPGQIEVCLVLICHFLQDEWVYDVRTLLSL